MPTQLTEDDEGKPVMYESDQVGRVVEVEGDTAYVDPDPGLTETISSKLGWADADEDHVALDDSAIADVTDDEVRLDVDV